MKTFGSIVVSSVDLEPEAMAEILGQAPDDSHVAESPGSEFPRRSLLFYRSALSSGYAPHHHILELLRLWAGLAHGYGDIPEPRSCELRLCCLLEEGDSLGSVAIDRLLVAKLNAARLDLNIDFEYRGGAPAIESGEQGKKTGHLEP